MMEREQSPISMGGMAITDQEFRLFQELVLEQSGISLGEHKRALLCARLAKRLRQHGLTRFQDYYEYLQTRDQGGEELRRMINAITTNKTDFFRERHHFDFLGQVVIPALRERAIQSRNRKVRIWSAGCSTGEEPYTIAIVVREAMEMIVGWDIRILASDIDTDVLAKAAEGIYAEEKISGMGPKLRRRHFEHGRETQERLVRVKQATRDLVTFRRLNLLDAQWPIQTKFDCIFCRNVMIYFDKSVQLQVVEQFEQFLTDGGYLFVGHSESLFGVTDRYEHLGGTIYRKASHSTT